MPWCEGCTRFYNPNTLRENGSCPTCDAVIADPPARAAIPWHFWLLLSAVVIYLGWRAAQGVSLLF